MSGTFSGQSLAELSGINLNPRDAQSKEGAAATLAFTLVPVLDPQAFALINQVVPVPPNGAIWVATIPRK